MTRKGDVFRKKNYEKFFVYFSFVQIFFVQKVCGELAKITIFCDFYEKRDFCFFFARVFLFIFNFFVVLRTLFRRFLIFSSSF